MHVEDQTVKSKGKQCNFACGEVLYHSVGWSRLVFRAYKWRLHILQAHTGYKASLANIPSDSSPDFQEKCAIHAMSNDRGNKCERLSIAAQCQALLQWLAWNLHWTTPTLPRTVVKTFLICHMSTFSNAYHCRFKAFLRHLFVPNRSTNMTSGLIRCENPVSDCDTAHCAAKPE